jgi:hypothetical protein
MPKDAKKNIDRYKIRGGDINEFEFHRNQEQFVEQNPKPAKAAKAPKRVSAKKPAARKAAKSKS